MTLTTTTGITDEQQNAEAREIFEKLSAIDVKAPKGKCVVYFFGFRKDGVIEIPDEYIPNSVEAVVWHDNTGYKLERGTRIMVHPKAGTYFEVNGVRLCNVKPEAMLCVEGVEDE